MGAGIWPGITSRLKTNNGQGEGATKWAARQRQPYQVGLAGRCCRGAQIQIVRALLLFL